VDATEIARRRELLALYQSSPNREPIEFTAYSMDKRR
jgi:hypothetical protein